jgi:hypothetical protein
MLCEGGTAEKMVVNSWNQVENTFDKFLHVKKSGILFQGAQQVIEKRPMPWFAVFQGSFFIRLPVFLTVPGLIIPGKILKICTMMFF